MLCCVIRKQDWLWSQGDIYRMKQKASTAHVEDGSMLPATDDCRIMSSGVGDLSLTDDNSDCENQSFVENAEPIECNGNELVSPSHLHYVAFSFNPLSVTATNCRILCSYVMTPSFNPLSANSMN